MCSYLVILKENLSFIYWPFLNKDLFYLNLISFTLCSNNISSKLGGPTFKSFPLYQTSVKKMYDQGCVICGKLVVYLQVH